MFFPVVSDVLIDHSCLFVSEARPGYGDAAFVVHMNCSCEVYLICYVILEG